MSYVTIRSNAFFLEKKIPEPNIYGRAKLRAKLEKKWRGGVWGGVLEMINVKWTIGDTVC